MKKIVVILLLLLVLVGCNNVIVIGTPTNTSIPPTETLRATVTPTVTNTMTPSPTDTPGWTNPTETATPSVTPEITEAPTQGSATPTPIVPFDPTPLVSGGIHFIDPDETEHNDSFIEVVVPVVNVRRGSCLICSPVLVSGFDTPDDLSDDVNKQLFQGDIRVVYSIVYYEETQQYWARITMHQEDPEWVSANTLICRASNGSLSYCTRFK